MPSHEVHKLTTQLANGQLSRRDFISGSTVLGFTAPAISTLMAVHGGISPAVAAGSAAQEDLTGSIELYFPRTDVCRLCGAVDYWNEQHPNATVIDKDIPWNLEQQLAALTSGQGGPDLYQSNPQTVLRDMLGGKLLDLTEVIEPIKNLYLAYKLDQFRHPINNRIYAFPWQVGVSVMYYRQDILDKLGMDEFPKGWTWDEHEELAERAKKDLGIYTNWMGPGAHDNDSHLFQQMVWQAGGTFVSQDWTEIQVDSPICVDVARRLQRWWSKGLMYEGVFYSAPLWGAMRDGLLWSVVEPSWWILGMRNTITRPEDHVGDWRIAPLPVFTEGGARTANAGGAGLVAPAYTENPALVKAFGEFATTDLNATVPTIQNGTVVAALTSFSHPDVLDITFDITSDQRVHELFAELVPEVPSTFFYSAGWTEIIHIIAQNLMSIMGGEVEVEPGLADIADQGRAANERWLTLLEQEPAS